MKNIVKVDVVASDGSNQTFGTISDEARHLSKRGQGSSMELYVFLNGLHKDGGVVGVERGPDG